MRPSAVQSEIGQPCAEVEKGQPPSETCLVRVRVGVRVRARVRVRVRVGVRVRVRVGVRVRVRVRHTFSGLRSQCVMLSPCRKRRPSSSCAARVASVPGLK